MYELTHATKRAVSKRLTFGRRGFTNTSTGGTTNIGCDSSTEHEVPPSGGHSAELAPPSSSEHSVEEVPPSGAHFACEHFTEISSSDERCVELELSLQVENTTGS